MSDNIEQTVATFNDQSRITPAEFRAWLAGVLMVLGDNPMTSDITDAVVGMTLRVNSDPTFPPIPPHPIPRPMEPTPYQPTSPRTPWQVPDREQYPGIPPVWCDSTTTMGNIIPNTTFTGSTNGSETKKSNT